MADTSTPVGGTETGFRRVLRLRDLVIYGIILIQPTAPMPIFGVISQVARGHVVTAVLIAMVAMLFTAISYGRMARVYPSAGSAYTYVAKELHPGVGYLVGWSITMDYLLNPIISTIWCSKAAENFLPHMPYSVLVVAFASLFTFLNLRAVESSARVNRWMALGLGAVVLLFLGSAVEYLIFRGNLTFATFVLPFYNPKTFSWPALSSGTAIAALTYIGFDGVSTLSEEVENPRRNILLATVLTCVVTGVLASLEVYAGQLVWPDYHHYPDVDTAIVSVAGRAGGLLLFVLVNLALLVAQVGSGASSQLGAARLLFGMGRENALPRRFFGVLDPIRKIPRNNVLFSGAIAVIGALAMDFQLGAELLNFGAFVAFMGVNASAFKRSCILERRWQPKNWAPPVLGFVICFYIWLNLSLPAKIAGAVWLSLGVLYGATRGKLRRDTAQLSTS
jgi:putrescine importer